MNGKTSRIVAFGAIFVLTLLTARPSEAFIASLNVTPTSPTDQSNIEVSIDLTNDTLNFCDYEVRLVAAYGGLTQFDRTVKGNVIEYQGRIIPHLIAPTEVIPCNVACIAIAKAPEAVYSKIEVGKLRQGVYTLRVILPELCGMETPCVEQPRVECEFKHPLTTTIRVGGPMPVEPRGKLTTTWAKLRRGFRDGA